jgi:GTPase
VSDAVHTTRAGFVALAGRPNVGKSTLVNGLVGQKVAIVSDKPQTTRRAIRGVATADDHQLVLVDLPGVQRPRDALTERMQRRVESEVADSDAALFVVNGAQGIGPGDRFIATILRRAAVPVVLAVNKIDRLDRGATLAMLAEAAALDLAEDVFPISARTGEGMGPLREHLATLMPEGPFLFPAEDRSDQSEDVMMAELIREQVLRRTFQEVPHSVEVKVDEIDDRGEVMIVRALVWVEAESQKGILIGAGGRMIKAVGTAARKELEREVGGRVHLELSVRVRRGWRGDEGLLDRLGIE